MGYSRAGYLSQGRNRTNEAARTSVPRSMSDPANDGLLARQRAVGNQAVARLLRPSQVPTQQSGKPLDPTNDGLLARHRSVGNQAVTRLLRPSQVPTQQSGKPLDLATWRRMEVCEPISDNPLAAYPYLATALDRDSLQMLQDAAYRREHLRGGIPHNGPHGLFFAQGRLKAHTAGAGRRESAATSGSGRAEVVRPGSRAWASGDVRPGDALWRALSDRSSGRPLGSRAGRELVPESGEDLGDVRIHSDAGAAALARDLQADAFTRGDDVYFAPGRFDPGTGDGRALLRHELAHVLQQRRGEVSSFAGQLVPEGHESEARAASGDAYRGAEPERPSLSVEAIQRQPKSRPAKSDPPPFKPRKATLEDVVKNMQGLGGPYADLKAWTDTFEAGKFLGHPIDAGRFATKGVRPEFQALLDAAEPKINDEYKKSGNPIPKGYGIRSVGGYREEISVHGAGVAIDIDAGDNPYVMHELDENKAPTALSVELGPVYTNIAEFMLNDPIDGEQSIIPSLIGSGENLPKGGKANRRERLGQYWDRLKRESDAMREYFRLMQDDTALQAYLAGPWAATHPKATPPSLAEIKKQMWHDYALLGGAIPKGGPPGIPDFAKPRDAGRPFHPTGGAQKDPASGFLTIPREVVLGLGQVVGRWGAIDFGVQSGDVMHFDDRHGVGQPFEDAKPVANAAVDAENKAAKEAADKAKAEADKAAAGSGSGTAPAPAIQRQPAQRQTATGPGHRVGEAWDYGPISARKSVSHDLVTYIGWIKDVERGYGPDKQMVLQRLRRLYYSSYSGTAGPKFDRVIAEQAGAEGPPLTVLMAPAAAVDGLYETDVVVTPDGRKLDPGHILAALDLQTAGATWKASMGEIADDTTMLGLVTWTGDLASWWLEWTIEAMKMHDAPRTAPTGPATEEGPPDEAGADPALDPRLWEKIGRGKAPKDDLLGDIDAQVLARTSTQRSTFESVKRDQRVIRDANIGTELTAPVSTLLETYYGIGTKIGTGTATPPSANRFTSFVRLASPPIPFQEAEAGGVRTVSLAPDAEQAITKAIENTAFLLVSQGTSHEPHEHLRKYGWRIKDIAKRFTVFLDGGLKKGDAPWL